MHAPPQTSILDRKNLKSGCYSQKNSKISKKPPSFYNLQPAVNRQPGYRRGDREVVGRDYIIFLSKKNRFFISQIFLIFVVDMHVDHLKMMSDDPRDILDQYWKVFRDFKNFRNFIIF